ncbi:SDR family oxidoreductase [Nordella sp. HKS 07]|uniref:SDR family oxidoreductase n=1 Tax=Nordella sp. HKS 07 TaxID=2712222 RepID=UPI0013E1267A|nr:SDR family oxidoreductase [Nordella sp. HKS 07]QIG48599.1 SDR family oxidoreductase [Nordella sp. HKS 07]
MILITGATGQVGGAALNALVAASAEVRVLVRRSSGFTGSEGVEVMQGSFDDDKSLARALEGVYVMLLAGRDSPDSVSQHQRVLAHARRAGVRHIVKLSAIGASPESPIALMREHHQIDEEIRESPGDWTLLKPHLYMQNLLRAADAVRREGRLSAPMGRDRFPLVDASDVGAAAAVILVNPTAHAAKEYKLTGPVTYNYEQVASALAAVAGHAIAYEPVAPEDFEARLLAMGIPTWRAFDLAHIASAYSAAENAISPDLPMLLGRKPRSLYEFIADNQNAFSS